jgi:hypothetical protein
VFGVVEPDCFGLLEVDTASSLLFIPRLPEDYATVMGQYVQLDFCPGLLFSWEAAHTYQRERGSSKGRGILSKEEGFYH